MATQDTTKKSHARSLLCNREAAGCDALAVDSSAFALPHPHHMLRSQSEPGLVDTHKSFIQAALVVIATSLDSLLSSPRM
eukprot:775553-Amphidinium_carterae.1